MGVNEQRTGGIRVGGIVNFAWGFRHNMATDVAPLLKLSYFFSKK